MVDRLRRNLMIGVPAALALRPFAAAAQAPLRIEITEGVIEPMPFAAPGFVPDSAAAADIAARITQVVVDDLVGTGLFREVPRSAHIGRVSSFDAPVAFADWKAINAQALITGAVGVSGDRAQVRFRLWDVFAQAPLGEGLQFDGSTGAWRRLGHKVADQVYARLTGEGGYFDSRVAFVAASGPKEARRKQIGDHGLRRRERGDADRRLGAGADAADRARRAAGAVHQLRRRHAAGDDARGRRAAADGDLATPRGMTFAPRFSPDGGRVVYSRSVGTGSDIFVADIGGGGQVQLTRGSSINTAPRFSPDGNRVVFESDRGGTQQLYVMSAAGGEASRISFGDGRYATPVWSPRGDMIAFTKIAGGRFHIGVMRQDGSGEKLLTGELHRRGADLGAERAGADVLPRDAGAERRAADLFGGHHRAEPATSADGGLRLGPVVVGAAELRTRGTGR